MTDASKVPPPRSYTTRYSLRDVHWLATWLWAYSRPAADGSLYMQRTWNPARRKPSRVRKRWLLLALAGDAISTSNGSFDFRFRFERSYKSRRKQARYWTRR